MDSGGRLCEKTGLSVKHPGLTGDFCQLRRNRIMANARLRSIRVSDKTRVSTHIGLEGAFISKPYSPLLIRSGDLGSDGRIED